MIANFLMAHLIFVIGIFMKSQTKPGKFYLHIHLKRKELFGSLCLISYRDKVILKQALFRNYFSLRKHSEVNYFVFVTDLGNSAIKKVLRHSANMANLCIITRNHLIFVN